MKALARRSDSTANRRDWRLGLAFAASFALHAALLVPPGMPSRSVAVPPAPPIPLQATLTAPMLATQPETHATPVEERPPDPPAAVPPAPTFRKAVPKPLAGLALDTALAALAREAFYPREAIERGLEGRVVLLLTLDAAGGVLAIEVADSSGHALLDDAALRAGTRVGSLPASGRQVLLPVEFRLE